MKVPQNPEKMSKIPSRKSQNTGDRVFSEYPRDSGFFIFGIGIFFRGMGYPDQKPTLIYLIFKNSNRFDFENIGHLYEALCKDNQDRLDDMVLATEDVANNQLKLIAQTLVDNFPGYPFDRELMKFLSHDHIILGHEHDHHHGH